MSATRSDSNGTGGVVGAESSRATGPELTSAEVWNHLGKASFAVISYVTPGGEVTDASVEEFLRNYIAEFHGFITRVYTALPRSG